MHIKSKILIFTIHVVYAILCVKIEMKRFYKIGVKRLGWQSAGPCLPLQHICLTFKIFQIFHIYQLDQFYLVMPSKVESNEPFSSSFYRLR